MPKLLRTLCLALSILGAGHLAEAAEHGEHAGHDEEAAHEDADHLSEGHGLRVLHSWTRATSGREAFVFTEIENVGDSEIVLEGAAAEIADTATLVGLTVKDGELTFEALPSLPIPPGREMVLAPDGLAIRLDGLKRTLDKGDSFPLDLRFSNGTLEVHVATEAADATRHSHAGHAH